MTLYDSPFYEYYKCGNDAHLLSSVCQLSNNQHLNWQKNTQKQINKLTYINSWVLLYFDREAFTLIQSYATPQGN
jgi:hypothetical protein